MKTLTLHPSWFETPAIRTIRKIMNAHAPAGSYRFVGGCVRDAIMNRPTNDIDIATTLTPQLVSDIFTAEGYTVVPTGIEHGTVTVVIDHTPYEFTTLRRDVTTDGRRATVEFTKNWADDAQRRDFRFNALYLDADGIVHDPTQGGIGDAKTREINFVGDADTRLMEDHLRSLRLFRFMAVLNGKASAEALAACKRQKDGISTLSGERIEKELSKLLGAVNPLPSLDAMMRTGVYETILPADLLDRRRFDRVCMASQDWQLRFAALFEWNLEAAQKVMSRLRFSNVDRKRVTMALRDGPITDMGEETWFDGVERLIYRKGAEAVSDRMILTWAAGLPMDVEIIMAQITEVAAKVPRRFPITGEHLMDRGVQPGKRMGEIMREMEDWWVKAYFPPLNRTLAKLDEILS